MEILVDSNIWIYLENGGSTNQVEAELCIRSRMALYEKIKEEYTLCFSPTIFREMLVGIEIDRKYLDELFKQFECKMLEENLDIMELAAKKYTDYILENRNLKEQGLDVTRKKSMPNDCLIGATASFHGVDICTRNVGDFSKYFPELKVFNPFDN